MATSSKFDELNHAIEGDEQPRHWRAGTLDAEEGHLEVGVFEVGIVLPRASAAFGFVEYPRPKMLTILDAMQRVHIQRNGYHFYHLFCLIADFRYLFPK